MEIIIRQEEIAKRVKEVAESVSIDHIQNDDSVTAPVLVCILNGAFHFFSDLTRMMSIDCEVDFIRLKSYAGQDNSQGVSIIKGFELDLTDKCVYLVDDILDSGETMKTAIQLAKDAGAATVKVVTLLKRNNDVMHPDFYGFEIGSEWVLGYGLDDYGLKRHERHIYKI